MKKIILVAVAIFVSSFCMAQEELSFPFQGGHPIFNRFFRDSVIVTPEIIAKKATGSAVFKFTADINGNISKIVVYYTDDLMLTPPIIAALKKSTHKWIIPNHEKFHDFILPFSMRFNIPLTGNAGVQRAYYDFYLHHKPMMAADQIPMNEATLLPPVEIFYDLQ